MEIWVDVQNIINLAQKIIKNYIYNDIVQNPYILNLLCT